VIIVFITTTKKQSKVIHGSGEVMLRGVSEKANLGKDLKRSYS
jgi:hypothetical protein